MSHGIPCLVGLGQCLPPEVAEQYLHDCLLLQHGGQFSPSEFNVNVCGYEGRLVTYIQDARSP